jgi:hypothetical protein
MPSAHTFDRLTGFYGLDADFSNRSARIAFLPIVCTMWNMVMANAHLRVLGTSEVALRMGLTTASVRRFAISGDLKGRKLAGDRGGWVFDEDEVERFIKRQEKDRDPSKGGRPRKSDE